MAEELNLDHFDLGTFVDYVHALKQERDELRAQLPSQGGEAVAGTLHISHFRENPAMANIDFQLIADLPPGSYNLYTHPADQVADDLTMVKVPRELLEDLRDCANECYNHARLRGTSGLDSYDRLTEQADAKLSSLKP